MTESLPATCRVTPVLVAAHRPAVGSPRRRKCRLCPRQTQQVQAPVSAEIYWTFASHYGLPALRVPSNSCTVRVRVASVRDRGHGFLCNSFPLCRVFSANVRRTSVTVSRGRVRAISAWRRGRGHQRWAQLGRAAPHPRPGLARASRCGDRYRRPTSAPERPLQAFLRCRRRPPGGRRGPRPVERRHSPHW